MTQPMDNKDRVISILAALLLMMIAVVSYQRTVYEDELGSMRHQMGIKEQIIKQLQNDND